MVVPKKNVVLHLEKGKKIQQMKNTEDNIKKLAKKVLDMYIYQHISVGIAIALVTKDINIAVKIKEYINDNF